MLGLLLIALVVKGAGFYLTYAPLEYQRYGDRLVAYDRWLDEPQWSASIDALRDIEVVHDRFQTGYLVLGQSP
ncbi:hypothetical protein G3I44_17915 [Halogeometricum borinquense]|uniref:Uncharacterized protein n=1 Tax=Halogeometricum borinquense TaxID=60847 RepID=A0A6C0USQ5_9EURY|nr:hypothetical protein [Halogeometricum borinquense]QIB75988.1 hypothetical protein G3I44_17915 [Halogeometricum borinquense]